MISDYPFGDGGGSFKYVHGGKYISQIVGEDAEDRSLHNGYLTEATEWGIQGLALRLVFLISALIAAYRTTTRCRLEGRLNDALMGLCFIVAAAGFLIHCFFGSFISNEWGYWIVPILLRYAELYEVPEPAVVTEPAGVPATASATAPWAVDGATAASRS
jgi:O-antigen ligase